ncbi:unnamed protein product [Urochloa decumbens]|uniref:F-box domain-containing protein n=1 Tax=Urochloa decumbens TaxID=240449 RepID=A0ABC9C093_9POAL
MPSSAARRRCRNEPAPPAPDPEAFEHARGPAHSAAPQLPPPAVFARRLDRAAPDAAAVERAGPAPVALPRLPPPAAFARKLGPAPLRAPPNPSPPEPQARPPTPRPLSCSSSRRRNRRRNRGRKAEEARDWAALPLDAISAILGKLDHIEILMGAGQVCRSWRAAARDEPALWRRIDMRGHPDLDRVVNLYGMARVAVRRARGQCEAFWAEYAADDDVLHLLGEQAPSLKSLRLICCQDIVEFEEEIKKFPLLEELEISLFTNIGGKQVFEEVGKSCPQLKHFRFNSYRFHNLGEYSDDDDNEFRYHKDDDALGIASMHGLRSLQLFGNDFTNEGLTAILDNCPYLESLDIRHCFNIAMDDALRAKCATIKTLRLPFDPTDDYDLQFEGPIWSGSGLGYDSDSDGCVYGGPDSIMDSDEYDDYCDPLRYLDGVYESELCPEDRMLLKGMRMLMRDDSDDDY